MSSEETPRDLKPTKVDYTVAAVRGTVNLVPIVGPFFAEIFGTVIPNQRIDRIAKFASQLEDRLRGLENGLGDLRIKDEEFTELIEEGFRQAAHSLTDERRRYIASLITSGLSSEEIEVAESRHLLRILGEINDVEVVWLRYHLELRTFGQDPFRETHKEILTPVLAHSRSTQDVRYKKALQDSYLEHLAQLGLLERQFRTDTQTRAPEFDRFSGAMEIKGYELTGLGSLLLREIGLETKGRE